MVVLLDLGFCWQHPFICVQRERRVNHQQRGQGGNEQPASHYDGVKRKEWGGGLVLRHKRTEEGREGCLLGEFFLLNA